MVWANFWQPTIHLQQNIFEKTCIKVGSWKLYASFAAFLRPNWSIIRGPVNFELSEEIEISGLSKTAIWPFSNIFQRLTTPRMIDQFGRKSSRKKGKHVRYQLLCQYFQKYFVVHERERWAVKDSSSTYICTMSNKKTHLADFETCVFRVYLRNHLSYIYLHPCLKSFQMRKEFFKFGHKISWYFQKCCFARKK